MPWPGTVRTGPDLDAIRRRSAPGQDRRARAAARRSWAPRLARARPGTGAGCGRRRARRLRRRGLAAWLLASNGALVGSTPACGGRMRRRSGRLSGTGATTARWRDRLGPAATATALRAPGLASTGPGLGARRAAGGSMVSATAVSASDCRRRPRCADAPARRRARGHQGLDLGAEQRAGGSSIASTGTRQRKASSAPVTGETGAQRSDDDAVGGPGRIARRIDGARQPLAHAARVAVLLALDARHQRADALRQAVVEQRLERVARLVPLARLDGGDGNGDRRLRGRGA